MIFRDDDDDDDDDDAGGNNGHLSNPQEATIAWFTAVKLIT
jgi:hypothetical protein